MVRMKISGGYSVWQLMHLYQFYTVATQLLPTLYASSSAKGKRRKSLGLEHRSSWAKIHSQICRLWGCSDPNLNFVPATVAQSCVGGVWKINPSEEGKERRTGSDWGTAGGNVVSLSAIKSKWRKLGSQRTRLKLENEILKSTSPSLEFGEGQ